MTYPNLHIFSQPCWHATAYIVGNPEALEALRDTLDKAIKSKRVASCEMMAGDGEGYLLQIIPVTKEGDWFEKNVALPYTDEVAVERREHAKFPHQLKEATR